MEEKPICPIRKSFSVHLATIFYMSVSQLLFDDSLAPQKMQQLLSLVDLAEGLQEFKLD